MQRELKRQVETRAAEQGNLLHVGGSEGSDRRPEEAVQHNSAPQQLMIQASSHRYGSVPACGHKETVILTLKVDRLLVAGQRGKNHCYDSHRFTDHTGTD